MTKRTTPRFSRVAQVFLRSHRNTIEARTSMPYKDISRKTSDTHEEWDGRAANFGKIEVTSTLLTSSLAPLRTIISLAH